MLDNKKLRELHEDFLNEQKDMLREQYEYYTLQMLNAHIDNVTENYFNAKTIVSIVEGLNSIEKQLKEKDTNKIGEEKENVKA